MDLRHPERKLHLKMEQAYIIARLKEMTTPGLLDALASEGIDILSI